MNLLGILRELNIDFKLAGESRHVREGWAGIKCPFCDLGRGNYGMGINLENGACSCWKCSRRNLEEALTLAAGRPYQEIRELLGDFSPARREAPAQGRLELPEGVGGMHRAHRDYLRARGFDPDEVAEVWGVGGIPFAREMSWRLFIPVHRDGRVVSWTTRTIAEGVEPRYKSARPEQEEVPRRQCLYGPRKPWNGHVCFVVEGPADAWAVGPEAVATLGLAYSKAQVKLIAQYPVRVVVFDDGAQQQAGRLFRQLESLRGETYRVELSGKDPAEAPKKEIKALRREFLGS